MILAQRPFNLCFMARQTPKNNGTDTFEEHSAKLLVGQGDYAAASKQNFRPIWELLQILQ